MLNHPIEELEKYQYKQKQIIEKLTTDLKVNIKEVNDQLAE